MSDEECNWLPICKSKTLGACVAWCKCQCHARRAARLRELRHMSTWSIVRANDDQSWPCTIVDETGRSLLGVHDGTPVIRDADLAERIVEALNATPEAIDSPASSRNATKENET